MKEPAAAGILFVDWVPAFAGMTTELWMAKEYGGHVYILASARNGTLYIGVTSNLPRRTWEHREGLIPGFTKQHGVTRLVYTEAFERIEDAIAREKAMKKWNRLWKLDLIERANPDWDDLYELGL